ncbi:hypothetical protein [Tabrizicola sp.]|uniref:hypothetical protein n=1 Tax=Tabrizicola sp. TaxID=2005166 RepID=UPI003F4079F4
MRRTLIALLLSSLALPALAEAPSPVKVAELSARLYAQGVEAGDPLLIISAAKLRKSLAPVASDRAATGGETVEGMPLTWEEMLASAEPLIEGDDILLGLIDDLRVETDKGVASGPVYNIGSLANGRGDTYPPIEFRGGEYAEVYVEAKAATNLNLSIYDDKGRLVCSDTDISHIAYCGWTPAQPGNFTLKVENKGPASASYALMTN